MQSAFHYNRDYNMVLTISGESCELPSRIYRMTTFIDQSNQSSLIARLFELIKGLSEHEQRSLLRKLEERLGTRKRKHGRKPFFMVVDYSTEDRVYKDYIQNISAGGLFIETQMPFAEGQELSISFPLPNYQKYIKISGEIVRTSPQGIGVKFKPANQKQEEMIKALMEMI
jgi:Tfp pilus assembly protein PilZ